jgi:peptidoglycan-N-acetylglucosamine deacetylase
MAEERLHPVVEPMTADFGWALTVDVEEWYHSCMVPDYVYPERRPPVVEQLETLLPALLELLAATKTRATFFVLGELAQRQPAIPRAVATAGHEVGSHGFLHLRAGWQSRQAFREDIRRSRLLLEDLLGEAVLGFRAPEWSLRTLANPRLRTVAEAGFLYDGSLSRGVGQGHRDNPRRASRITWGDGLSLLEFPPLTYGGALELPASGWTGRLQATRVILRAADQHRRAGGLPVAVVHPWELVGDDTPGEFSGLARFVHEAGRRTYRAKFERLCRARSWDSVASAAGLGGRPALG